MTSSSSKQAGCVVPPDGSSRVIFKRLVFQHLLWAKEELSSIGDNFATNEVQNSSWSHAIKNCPAKKSGLR